MIEYAINCIIKELGPVGLLVCGLYFFLRQPLLEISNSLKIINKETGEVRDALLSIKTILETRSKNED